jgi:hypothetical protein
MVTPLTEHPLLFTLLSVTATKSGAATTSKKPRRVRNAVARLVPKLEVLLPETKRSRMRHHQVLKAEAAPPLPATTPQRQVLTVKAEPTPRLPATTPQREVTNLKHRKTVRLPAARFMSNTSFLFHAGKTLTRKKKK